MIPLAFVNLPPPRPCSTWSGSVSRFRLVTGIAPFARIRSRLPLFPKSTNESPQPTVALRSSAFAKLAVTLR